jgi:hypothetical protein
MNTVHYPQHENNRTTALAPWERVASVASRVRGFSRLFSKEIRSRSCHALVTRSNTSLLPAVVAPSTIHPSSKLDKYAGNH